MTAHILASHEVTNVITALQHDNAVTYNITSSTVNEEDDTPKEYYRRAIVVLFREDILQHLNTRFIQGQQELVKDFSVVPSAMRHKGTWKEDFHELCVLYENDLPPPSHWMRTMDL